MGAHAFGVSVLHAVADLDCPAQALRQVGWPLLQVVVQRIQPLFIWGYILHGDVKLARQVIHEMGANQVGVASQFDPNTRFLVKSLSDFLICKIFIQESLQGIDLTQFV